MITEKRVRELRTLFDVMPTGGALVGENACRDLVALCDLALRALEGEKREVGEPRATSNMKEPDWCVTPEAKAAYWKDIAAIMAARADRVALFLDTHAILVSTGMSVMVPEEQVPESGIFTITAKARHVREFNQAMKAALKADVPPNYAALRSSQVDRAQGECDVCSGEVHCQACLDSSEACGLGKCPKRGETPCPKCKRVVSRTPAAEVASELTPDSAREIIQDTSLKVLLAKLRMKMQFMQDFQHTDISYGEIRTLITGVVSLCNASQGSVRVPREVAVRALDRAKNDKEDTKALRTALGGP